jgi:hypothetical protein
MLNVELFKLMVSTFSTIVPGGKIMKYAPIWHIIIK